MAQCGICFEEVNNFITIMGCNHEFCRDCLTLQISFNLIASRLPFCPSTDQNNQICNNLIQEDFVIENANDLLGRYELIKVETSIPPDDRFYCPIPTCSYPLSKSTAIRRSGITGIFPQAPCPRCEEHICLICKSIWHVGTTCDFHQQTEAFLEKMSPLENRHCPVCYIRYQKDSGCNHMTCSRCQAEFCYLCGVTYENGRATCECSNAELDGDNYFEDQDQGDELLQFDLEL